jgi:hypothetical protein
MTAPYSYAWAKLYYAVQELAAGAGGPRHRMERAYADHLMRLRDEDLPAELRADLHAIRTRMTRDRPRHPHESAAAASARSLSWQAQRDLALRILRMYDGVTRTMPVRSPEEPELNPDDEDLQDELGAMRLADQRR